MMTQSKERRQIEIVSLVQSSPGKLSVADLCEQFGVEVATIHRDLRELRDQGILIHSVKNGLQLLRPLTQKDQYELLSSYLSFVRQAIGFPKNLSLITKKLKSKSLDLFVTLVNAIEERRVLEIIYYKMFDDETVTRIIEPYDLIPTFRDWRLIARSDGIFKTFLVENIKEVRVRDRRFERAKGYDVSDLFRKSFEYWSGGEEIEVVLQFKRRVASIIKSGIWSEDQELKTPPNGSIVLKMKVNSLEEIGNWVMTWGGNVRVLKPIELRIRVLRKAQGIMASSKR
jgi:predicted DNA-binding transcriptional regulator YafY